mmetsp:Transcript_5552/g.9172  ORF Transcript_5552/g.9172 Transcript_5552/m.9172 type:complete len:1045 (-) Transcript_5552:25-3159(-)|eukprot:CAMPEP_0119015184 /NCGR_PEP_ID=MMETSP1176-20130426/10600_1 /TAXON_ID=265551 /ORGANISM="Synedropsis recta cf, Strain CCMP1620" /LENGTH=1044 /DNA_ID=CAMNT_0006968453 /DNA_START=106 /DNA_END=3240 /DNA_ORIENTATION=+
MTIYHGRTAEQKLLRNCLSDSCCSAVGDESGEGESNLVLVHGESGMGKSSLVEHAFRRTNCFYASGKCEELRQTIPFMALMDALEVLCSSIAEDVDSVIIDELQARFTSKSKLVTRVNAIRLLLGFPLSSKPQLKRQESGSVSAGAAALQLFKGELRDFLSIVATSTKPIVLFLDDVQWSSSLMLETVQFLNEQQIPNLLLVVAMRDGFEIPHQLDRSKQQIHLKSLSCNALAELVARQLKDDKADIDDLVELLHSRTGGNPLFATELLRRLLDDKLVHRHRHRYEWMWDLQEIRAKTSVSDNIADLLLRKMLNRSPCAQQLLIVAACTGSKFSIQMVKVVVTGMNYTLVEFEASLTQMEEEGMLDHRQQRKNCYKFAHDRIQQAAYGLVPENVRESMHLRIGRILLSAMPSPDHDAAGAWSLVTTDQLNHGVHLLSDQMEKVVLAELNLSSAVNASQKSAFLCAATYCRTGLELLGDFGWEAQPDLTKRLSRVLAEMEYCLGNREESQAMVDILLNKIDSLEEKLPVYVIKMEALSSGGHPDLAINVGLDVLGQLGYHFPRKVTMRHILVEVVKTKMLLHSMTDQDMLELPELTNVASLGALEIMSLLGCYAYSANEGLLMLILGQREMRIVLKEGLNKFAGDAFASYGVLMGHLGNIKEAHRFSEISLKLVERFDFKDHDSQTLLVNHFFLQHLQKPVHDSIDPLFQSYELGMESGDIHNASLAFLSYMCCYASCGLPLGPVIQDTEAYRLQLGDFSQDLALRISDVVYQSMLNLRGCSGDPLRLDGEIMREEETLRYAADTNNSFLRQMVYYQKAMLAIYFNDFAAAGEMASKLWNKSDNLVGSCTFAAGSTSFMFALSALGMCRKSNQAKYLYYRRVARKYTKKLEHWVKQGNSNVHHMLLILRAEESYVRKDKIEKVKKAYDKASSVSRRSGFTHNAALVSERCGRFFLEHGDDDWAKDYLKNAHVLYREWGALGKVSQLEKEFSWLVSSMPKSRRKSTNVKGISRFDSSAVSSHKAETILSSSFGTLSTEIMGLASSR